MTRRTARARRPQAPAPPSLPRRGCWGLLWLSLVLTCGSTNPPGPPPPGRNPRPPGTPSAPRRKGPCYGALPCAQHRASGGPQASPRAAAMRELQEAAVPGMTMEKTDTGLKRPIFVGIGGDSGTGKSTLTASFYRIFGESRITTLCLDDYHSLDRREHPSSSGLTALEISQDNDFVRMESQLLDLKRGHPIMKPVSDHRDRRSAPPRRWSPVRSSASGASTPSSSQACGRSSTSRSGSTRKDALKHRGRSARNVAKRGYAPEAVAQEIEVRRPDVEAHIAPQRLFAGLSSFGSTARPGTRGR